MHSVPAFAHQSNTLSKAEHQHKGFIKFKLTFNCMKYKELDSWLSGMGDIMMLTMKGLLTYPD